MKGIYGEQRRKVRNGRVGLPVEAAIRYPDRVVVFESAGCDCLYVMDEEGFASWIDELFERKFGGYNPAESKHKRFRRAILARSVAGYIADTGHLSIGPSLLENVGIDDEAMVVGTGDHVEIWNPAAWEKEKTTALAVTRGEEVRMRATCEKVRMVIDGVSVSSCTLVIAGNDDPTHGYRPFAIIENVATLPEHRQKGYAKQMLGMAVEKARGAGCYKVMLATGSSKEYVHKLYKSLGFDSSVKTCYTMSLE